MGTKLKQNKNLTTVFRSTTLRLTGWYLLTLMLLSLAFSIIIFQVASNEIETRLEGLQTSLQKSNLPNQPPIMIMSDVRANEAGKASANLSIELFYLNLVVLVIGGFGSYFFARRSLLPIEKAHDEQSRFTSDASHELRTPLAVMKTELEVALRDNTATIDGLKEVLSSNLEEVDKLTKLSGMLLSLSRLDSVNLPLGPVNLNKITRDTIKNFSQPSNRIILKSEGQQLIHGNETAVSDLIKILIDNSLQYSPAESTITIDISKYDECGKFVITNSGPGIDPDKLPHIFDRFYRADSSRTNGEHKGYGLGLALAKSIVDHHEGKITCESMPNKETVFTLLLPLHSKAQAKTKN